MGNDMRCPNYENCAQRPHMVQAGIGNLLMCPVCKTLYDPTSAMIIEEEFALDYNPGHNEDPEEWDEQALKDLYTGVW